MNVGWKENILNIDVKSWIKNYFISFIIGTIFIFVFPGDFTLRRRLTFFLADLIPTTIAFMLLPYVLKRNIIFYSSYKKSVPKRMINIALIWIGLSIIFVLIENYLFNFDLLKGLSVLFCFIGIIYFLGAIGTFVELKYKNRLTKK